MSDTNTTTTRYQFAQIDQEIETLIGKDSDEKAEIKDIVYKIKQEAQKGLLANQEVISRWMKILSTQAENIHRLTVAALAEAENSDNIIRSAKSTASGTSHDASLLRGALKLEASTSTPIVAAGTEFSIYVVIRNPFPVPVAIYSTETHIPVELSDEIWRKLERSRILQERSIKMGEASNVIRKLTGRIGVWLSDWYSWLTPDQGPRVAVAVSTEFQNVPKSDFYFAGDYVGKDKITTTTWNLNFAELTSHQVRDRLFVINEYIQGRQPVILNPGDSVVKHFILKTNRWIAFTPIAHTFQIQVKYELDGRIHVDTVPFSLNIRAALASSLIGAIIGSLLGSIVNPTNSLDWSKISPSILTSCIFAVIIVVAFARKNNIQQIVSVEDFWGGIFIGFLVGYSGETFINSVLGKPN